MWIFIWQICFTRKRLARTRFEFLPFGKLLKAQTDIAKKPYKTLDKSYKTDGTQNKNNKKPTLKNYSTSYLMAVIIVFTNSVVISKTLITFLSNQIIPL